MAEIEKKYTQEQKESFIEFVYNMIKEGNSIDYIEKGKIIVENDSHICKFAMSTFNEKEIFRIYLTNIKTNKQLHIDSPEFKGLPHIGYVQNKVEKAIDDALALLPKFFSDDELYSVIGDTTLLGQRSVKVNHLVDNIKKKKKRWF